MVVYTYDPNTQESETGGLPQLEANLIYIVSFQPWLHSQILSQKQNKNEQMENILRVWDVASLVEYFPACMMLGINPQHLMNWVW